MIKEIKKAAVIGSGIMGGGVAALLAGAGVEVVLLDIVPFDLAEDERMDPSAKNRIVETGLSKIAGAVPPVLEKKEDISLITTGNLDDDLEVVTECDWIVEAVTENLRIKNDLFRRIEKLRKAEAIVSSTTSGIPLSAMSKGCGQSFREHFLGTHFFNPVRSMRLLEIIGSAQTRSEVMDFVASFGRDTLGKGIVRPKDTPNFIANRIGTYSLCTTIRKMFEEDLTIPEADFLLGPAMGRPRSGCFGTADLVGIDTATHIIENMYDLCPGDEEREIFVVPDFVQSLVDRNRLGRKTGAGFYMKNEGEERLAINPATDTYERFPVDHPIPRPLSGTDRGSRFVWKVTAKMFIYAANRIPEITADLVEIDNAMKWGFGWPAGPFEVWDSMGIEETVEKMKAEGMQVPAKIDEMLEGGNSTFYRRSPDGISFYDFESRTYRPCF